MADGNTVRDLGVFDINSFHLSITILDHYPNWSPHVTEIHTSRNFRFDKDIMENMVSDRSHLSIRGAIAYHKWRGK